MPVNITVKMSPELKQRLNASAEQLHLWPGEIVRVATAKFLDELDTKNEGVLLCLSLAPEDYKKLVELAEGAGLTTLEFVYRLIFWRVE